MARITVEDCIDKFPSRFELVLVASHRARKLHSGEEPTIDKDNDKNTVIALREIADSTITVDQMKENLIQEYQTITITDEEEENLELDASSQDESIISSSDEIEKEMNDLVSLEDAEIENIVVDTENKTNDADDQVENEDQNKSEVPSEEDSAVLGGENNTSNIE